ncbi:hypothetical protein [Geomonas sp.]|uniref:hypothetical protein n=1 Tax=Geomonas sp. TaxID=2651584 RepID=UPI002B4A6616|nr:hypothetical protein [Geomonas sp.]HJV33425.1 hypothetical protein [Geomonas sp.]
MSKQRKIKRDYHKLSPSKALTFFKRVRHCLTENENFPDSTWGANTTTRGQYSEAVDGYEDAFNGAINGDRLLVADRNRKQDEIVVMLDEIASHLEAVSVRNPDSLLTSGFNVVQERRLGNRVRLPLSASTDFKVANLEHRGRAAGSSSPIAGAFNHEIHANYGDPSSEEDWIHKGIYADPSEMVIMNVKSGNVFFRMRSHGPDGAGPWSGTVSTFIT